MRVTIVHNRTKDEVKDAVARSIEELFTGLNVGPIVFTGRRKQWSGDVMMFSLTARMGFLRLPIQGSATVTDRDVTLEVDTGLLGKLIPEEAAKTRIEGSMKRLFT
jgi:hypothetical protein